jgi:predicted acylesterase/phospholipase RssA
MTAQTTTPRKKDPIPTPGDDVVPVPAPVDEEPPFDSFCDLVLTGGVASGVVYPWAIIELARQYRFRNIGGTSVGAMAAALAAAAEYGRRNGCEAPFEALRRSPASLAHTYRDGRTRMLSLFQTNPHGRRLIWLWGKIGRGNPALAPRSEGSAWLLSALGPLRWPRAVWRWLRAWIGPVAEGGDDVNRHARAVRKEGTMSMGRTTWRALWLVLGAYAGPWLLGGVLGFAGAKILARFAGLPLFEWTFPSLASALLAGLACAVVFLLWAFWRDFRLGVIENEYGLCKGGTADGPDENRPPGISEWLHDGIQASAGLKDDEPPLTFRDLWSAPLYPGAARIPCGPHDPQRQRSINLVMITTNVTHGRPYRLPLADQTSRLFFKLEELKGYFPACVLRALEKARPYVPQGPPGTEPDRNESTAQGLRELPMADLPVVVAARLSLSFPLLFSAVPLWAIDFEAPRGARTFRRCIFTDGGASSNFPIHLFDAAVPRWPTFGMWLDRRSPYRRKDRDEPGGEEVVWLPEFNGQGYGDSWNRFDPQSRAVDPDPTLPAGRIGPPQGSTIVAPPVPRFGRAVGKLLGFLLGIVTSATDWRDRTSFRQPHVRNRVARLLLLPNEGGLHIGMPRRQILEMAYRYGTTTGRKFVERFKEQDDGQPSRAWSEQRWVRFNVLVNGMREALDGLSAGAASSCHAEPLQTAIGAAEHPPGPVADAGNCHRIGAGQGRKLTDLLRELDQLERRLLTLQPPAFRSPPDPELRLRPPL